MSPDLLLVNGGAGGPATLRLAGGRIAAVDTDEAPACAARIDLQGGRLLPGLINAHDHLQLNALPRLKYRERYARVDEWIADIAPRLKSDPLLLANGRVPRAQRLALGGLKNLLSGVTSVAHHDPAYAPLGAADFPVRVLRGCGWSHSLVLDGAAAVQRSHARTPPARPWIIHAAEGCDAQAAGEFERLEALGCIGPNTRLVHGLGLGPAQQRRLVRAGAGLIWCPGSNLHLFGRTLDIRYLFAQRRLALGSDSRISGERDLLAELGLARQLSGLDEASLEELVTQRAAALLLLNDRGVLRRGALADLILLPPGLPLSRARRADLRLVMIGGRPRYADPDLARAFGAGAGLAPVRVDGRPKYLARPLLAALHASSLTEPGLLAA